MASPLVSKKRFLHVTRVKKAVPPPCCTEHPSPLYTELHSVSTTVILLLYTEGIQALTCWDLASPAALKKEWEVGGEGVVCSRC